MNDQNDYDLALIVSKRLRRKLLKASGLMVLIALGFTVICFILPHSF